jgi:hypothetical protein
VSGRRTHKLRHESAASLLGKQRGERSLARHVLGVRAGSCGLESRTNRRPRGYPRPPVALSSHLHLSLNICSCKKAPPFLKLSSVILIVMMHHVIYLPGVGDHKNASIQINAIKKWKKFGLDTQHHLINWNDNETFNDKKDAVIKLVDELYSLDKSVSIVGISAGASMAMNVYTARQNKISSVVFICGKINRAHTIGADYKLRNPRLFESVSMSEKAVTRLTAEDKAKMLTIQPIFDGTVTKEDGRIDGVKQKTIFAFLHPIAIYLSLTLYRRVSINFIKNKAVQ